ncbi:MAG: ABC transporter permease [Gammaproteobacteria bacterium]|nr:ABC transporter permease [Gammaproteobacteria bacterium]MDP2140286.1 ABC transporter permease [Gammaproteobacteria bacterium]MDP2346196.1 ABC transporter permease [Gammaproteobacteria bacterium]
MFDHYLRMGWRTLLKEKSYSLINVAGLTIGMACCMILGLYLYHALSYDRHHEGHENVYRVVNEFGLNGNVDFAAVTSTQLAPLLREQYPEIEAVGRFQSMPSPRYLLRSTDNQGYYWERLYSADNAVLKILTHDIIYGDPETALIDPTSMAVSESFAQRYFGDKNPLGESIMTDISTYRIDLVFADLPANSHLQYDALMSYNRIAQPQGAARLQQLWNIGAYTYVRMQEGFDPDNFSAISTSFYENNMAEMARQMNINATVRFLAEPIADIHLQSTTTYDFPRGSLFYVYAFAAIAVFVLAVACINYMNLATARSTRRAKEVGMRKVLGATQGQLVKQFIGESVLYALLSLMLAMLLAWATLRYTSITVLLDAPLSMSVLFNPPVFIALLLGSIALGVLSGLYPALYLSAIPPVAAFRGAQGTGRGGKTIRQVLVVLQFVISVAVISGTLLMLTQMNYVQSKALGFGKENRLIVRVAGADQIERLPALMTELRQTPGVLGVARTSHIPGQQAGLNALTVEDNNGVMQQQTLSVMNFRPGVIDTLGMRLIEGRDFDENRENDAGNTVLVNQSLVQAMGWENAIGKRLQQFGPNAPTMEVIGVVEDFHFEGLQHPVVPAYMAYFMPNLATMDATNRGTYSEQLILNIRGDSVQSVIAMLEARWPTFDPGHPFDFTFLETTLNALYGSEQRQMQLIGIFAALCIFISCLGLFGLSAFNTAQRTREIGVRKVLGASTASIILLLFRHILVLVAIAAVIASALAFWAINLWLQGFYYRIDLLGPNLILFAVATAIAIAVAFITMALQSLKTAQSNPVLALRYE